MSWDVIADNLPLYLSGAWVTLQLLAISLAFGLVIAIPLAVLGSMPGPLNRIVWVYTYVFRGTPLLVQLFLIYYGLAQFEWVQQSALWPWLSSAWFCACLTFVLNTCAYTVEMLAGAIRETPAGEIEAAQAAGYSRWRLYLHLIIPSALRRALPYYGNEVILMLHATSLAFTATVPDILKVARDANAATFMTFQAFGIAALLYMLLSFLLVGLFRLAERRWMTFLGPTRG